MAEPEKIKQAHELIKSIAGKITRDEAAAIAQQKFGVSLDEVIKYDTDNRGVEIYGVPVPRNIGAAIVGYGQGLTSNFGDELRGRMKQGAAYLTGEDPEAAYQAEMAKVREMEGSLRDTNPVPYYGGQVAGGINQAVVMPGGASTKATTLGGSMVRGAGSGAIQGAVAGVGASDSDSWLERGLGGAFGAATGAAAGAVMPLVTKAGGAVYDKAKGFFQDLTQAPINLAPAVSQNADAVTQAVQPSGPIPVAPSEYDSAMGALAKNLDRDQISNEQLKRAMDAMGSRGRIADVGPNVRDAGGAIANQPGTGKSIVTTALENRQLGQQAELLDAAQTALSSGSSDPAKFAQNFHQAGEELIKARRAAADPAYEAFRQANGGVSWNDDLAKLFERPAIKKAWKYAQEIAGNEGIDLPKVAEVDPVTGDVTKWVGIPDNRTLDYIKRGLDDVIEGSRDIRGKVSTDSGRSVETLKNQFLDIIDEINPAYKEARNAYSGPSQSLKALEKGRAFLKDDAEITASEIAKMTDGDKEFFRIGVLRDLADLIKRPPPNFNVSNKLRGTGFKEKLAAAFPSEDAYNKFVQKVENEARFAATKTSNLGNSSTASRLAAMGDTNNQLAPMLQDVASGNTSGLTSRAIGGVLDFLTKDATPSEGARGILADILYRQGPEALEGLLPVIDAARRSQAARAGAGSTSRYVAGQQAGGMGGLLTGER